MIGTRAKNKLRGWWLDSATNEIDGMMDKLAEYGTGDLHEIGRQMMKIKGAYDSETTDQQCYEIGITFYALGKIQQIITAAEQDKLASTDTWHDLAIYAKMVLAGRAEVMPK